MCRLTDFWKYGLTFSQLCFEKQEKEKKKRIRKRKEETVKEKEKKKILVVDEFFGNMAFPNLVQKTREERGRKRKVGLQKKND